MQSPLYTILHRGRSGGSKHSGMPSIRAYFLKLSVVFSLALIVILLIFYWNPKKSNAEKYIDVDEINLDLDERTPKIFKAFYKCVRSRTAPLKGKYAELWYNFADLTADCDHLDVYKAIDLRSSTNNDENKYIAFPKRQNESLTMVTLGIGHDVSAEIKLKELYPNIEFFGADPNPDINKEIYENQLGGKYFNYAISDQNGDHESVIFKGGNIGYEHEVTRHTRVDNFFKNIIRKSRIDILWMDIEGNEYPILDQLHRNSTLEKEGVKICQMNVEMHKDMFGDPIDEMRRFHDFVWKVLEDRKYVIFKPVLVKFQKLRFIRVFILNIADKECTDLYLK